MRIHSRKKTEDQRGHDPQRPKAKRTRDGGRTEPGGDGFDKDKPTKPEKLVGGEPIPELPSAPGQGGKLGFFDPSKDLLLANFDAKEDEDDFHAVAGLATMLHDPRLAGVQYHVTTGAYGGQDGQYLDAPELFKLAFEDEKTGEKNWADAHKDRKHAVELAATKALATLKDGGKIWVAEGGQSDFTADVVRKVKELKPDLDPQNVKVLHHHPFNVDNTSSEARDYLEANTDFLNPVGFGGKKLIPDGNEAGNGTPGLTTENQGLWDRVLSNPNLDPRVAEIWTAARQAAESGLGQGVDNSIIEGGGMDFSDTVIPLHIFGFAGDLGDAEDFFDEFLSGSSQ